MNIEEAIRTAIEFETMVRDIYADAVKNSNDAGKRVFETMAQEEQDHLDYLNSRLERWNETGELDYPQLQTAIPPKDKIEEGVRNMEKGMETDSPESELEMLKKALNAEKETSAFYQKMVEELPEDGKKLFRRFMEIEEGHVAIVQAEIDALTGSGYWFDFPDVSFEM